MDEKTKILYHGTDARFVRMSKEERMEYLNKCNKVIDYLWGLFQPLWTTTVIVEISLPNGEKGYIPQRKIEIIANKFTSKEERIVKCNFFESLSRVEAWKKGNTQYQYGDLYLTSLRKTALNYARRAFAGGETGLNAYRLIECAELLQIDGWNKNDDINKTIIDIKQTIGTADNDEPVVITVTDIDFDKLYADTGNSLDANISQQLFRYVGEYSLDLKNAFYLRKNL